MIRGKRTVTASVLLVAGVLVLSGCSSKAEPFSPSGAVTNVEVGEAYISDGRYLDCVSSEVGSSKLMLDCDWSNPRTESDPAKHRFGSYNLFKKNLADGRILDCIAFDVDGYNDRSVDNCDWEHAVRPGDE